jgi:hypothetical protein
MIMLIMPQTKAEVPTVAVKSKALVVVKAEEEVKAEVVIAAAITAAVSVANSRFS